MRLPKYLSHPSLVIYFFPILPIKLKLGLQTNGRLLRATTPGPIIYDWRIRKREHQSDHIYYTLVWQEQPTPGPIIYDWRIRKREHQSDHIYYTLVWQVLGLSLTGGRVFWCLSPVSANCAENAGPKQFSRAKLASSSNFNFRGHISSTTGAALRLKIRGSQSKPNISWV